ncbi:MAG: OmpA family protein [Acidobacteria bacterium]|nr:OmpA family protein [Acidobacteriota bacterium]
MLRKRHISVLGLAVLLAMFSAGCKKKAPPPPPPPPPKVEAPPPPPPEPPVINQFVAEPSSIERGQSSTLRWAVNGATEVAINQGIGRVQPNGSQRVFPNNSTTYALTATGPGGAVSRSATVEVTAPPPPPPPPPAAPKRSLTERLSSDVQDAYFDFDKSDIREDARNSLTKNADALKAILGDFPAATLVIEGHCDERGSAEYNLGLGDRRAASARDFLVQLGVPPDRLKTISYGKERPQCTESDEDCWQRNRRAHVAPGQ